MEIVSLNLLELLHKSQVLYSTDYSGEFVAPVDLLENILENSENDEPIIDGVMFLQKTAKNSYLMVDGTKRIISFSLLLHALCEVYKFTNDKNVHAIELIKKRYLFYGKHTKIHLHGYEKIIYEKLVHYERMTDEEKEHPMFKTLHEFWAKIKLNNISATRLFNEIKKINVLACIYETADVDSRDLHHYLNCTNQNCEGLLLITNFIEEKAKDNMNIWLETYDSFKNNNLKDSFKLFIRDFLTIQKNGIQPRENELYLGFKRYFNRMIKHQSSKEILENIKKSSQYYIKILQSDFEEKQIKESIQTINNSNMQETYPYLLEVVDDYVNGRITKETISELLNTVILFIAEQRNGNISSTINFGNLSHEINKRIDY